MSNWWDDLMKGLGNFWNGDGSHGKGKPAPVAGRMVSGNPSAGNVLGLGNQTVTGSPSSGLSGQESDFLHSLRNPQTSQYGPLVPNYVPNPAFQQTQQPQETPLPSMADAIAQAQQMWNQLGGGGYKPAAHVNYDPLRQDARGRANEYDAKMAALYNSLSSDFQNSGQGIAANYDQGAAQQQAAAQQAQQTIQQASDAANSDNQANLAALGIQQANQNIQDSGQSLSDQTAAAIADSALRQQAASTQMAGDKQASVQANNETSQAAHLAGGEEQSRIQDQLSQLLAQYALQEQQANTQIDQQNAAGAQQAQQNKASFLSSQANNLLSNAWQSRQYQDQVAQQQYQAMLQQQALQQQAAQQQSNADQASKLLHDLTNAKGNKVSGTDYAPFLKFLLPSAPGAIKVG